MSVFKKQLKSLKNITLNAEAKKAQREAILSQLDAVEAVSTPAQTFVLWAEALAPWKSVGSFSRSFGTLAIAGLVAMGGSIATVGAAKGSLPGDRLYSIKLASEQVQLALTTDDVKKIRFQLEIAENRMNELQKITSKESGGGRKVNIEEAAKNLTKEIRAVKDSVAKVNAVNTEAAANLAQEVSDKTKGYEQALKETNVKIAENTTAEEQATVPAGEAKAAVEEAARVASFTSTDALRVLVYRENTEKVKIDEQQVRMRLEGEIKEVSGKFETYGKNLEELKKEAGDVASVITEVKSKKPDETPEKYWRAPNEEEAKTLVALEEGLKQFDASIIESAVKDFKEREVLYLVRLFNDTRDYKTLIDEILKLKETNTFLEKQIGDRKAQLGVMAKDLEILKTAFATPLPKAEEKKEETKNEENVTEVKSEEKVKEEVKEEREESVEKSS